VNFVHEHAGLDTRVVLHELLGRFDIGAEQTDAASITVVGYRADDGKLAGLAQLEVAPAVPQTMASDPSPP
jgi:hypothetical protein